MRSRFFSHLPLLVLFWLLPLGAYAVCVEQARDDYERLYCQIRAEGGGAGLPSLAEFRRNPRDTQVLLLKRPAERLGLTLPARERQPNTAEVQERQRAQVQKRQRDQEQERPRPDPEAMANSAATGLDGCQLDRAGITCGDRRFRLMGNRPNSELESGALEPENGLTLPRYQGPDDDEEALRLYLLEAYERYIEKMLSIGLGGSTLSFTKFYYGYQNLGEEKHRFPQRMETLFRFLRQDKASLAVKAHYSDKRPTDLTHCGRLNATIIVCDQADINWVYVRSGG
jgi:hypothetical protein